MNTLISWKSLILASIVIGMIWPLPYFITPSVGLFFTVIFSLAASLFFATLSPSGEMLSFGNYFMYGGITGLIAFIVAIIERQVLCRIDFLSQNNMCTAPIAVEGFAIGAFGLYLFLLVMIYFFLR